MTVDTTMDKLQEVSERIKEMRSILGYSEAEMAKMTEVTPEEYEAYENGTKDLPFTFIHKCAIAFNIQISELLEGRDDARLTSYTVTRRGEGRQTAKEEGIDIRNLAPVFKHKICEPYYVRYEYSEALQHQPIHLTSHKGQEFDYVLSGSMIVQVGKNRETLHEGDTIYYNSATPHGMIATGGADCIFLAVVLPEEQTEETVIRETVAAARPSTHLIVEKFTECTEDEKGNLLDIRFKNTETFNFGFDIVDAIADKYPEKLAMLHLDRAKKERRFTFKEMKKESARCANYFSALGIGKGDKVMLVLKRHWQFWPVMIGLHKLGAIAVPATYQLKEHDFEYRFNAASIKAIVCTADGDTTDIVDRVLPVCPSVDTKVIVGGRKEGWRDFDREYKMYSSVFRRSEDTPCGETPALMFFSSGTTGNPKMVEHKHTYALGHFVTAKYWHCCEPDGLHFTISDTGWGKSLWGKLYGQWMCEGAVFVYDFDRFNAAEILPLFAQYQITTFCAPPTMLRMMIREDLSGYDFSSIRNMTTAGEALNPEVAKIFYEATGLQIMEGFGQTETTLTIANFRGNPVKLGSMGKASPAYHIDVVDAEGNPVKNGDVGEIVIRLDEGSPAGLFIHYYRDEELTASAMRDGCYHTGDTAWRDEDGYFFYVGRADDIIKSSGYRIGPFEIESVIMELPYVLECGVSAAPDEIRGQIVKASVVLTKDTVPSAELAKEIQNYVKAHTAPYKYPRLVVFRDELPKTISGKIQRNKL
ncbi:MAG: AMP-binding protein [Lachnospiraceae bacterium]|nr:AMP-binding protein [Lachnospiraceae bacterium]